MTKLEKVLYTAKAHTTGGCIPDGRRQAVQPYEREYFRKDGSRVPVLKGPLHIRLGCLDSTASVRNGRIRGADSCLGRRDICFRRANSVGGLCDSRVL